MGVCGFGGFFWWLCLLLFIVRSNAEKKAVHFMFLPLLLCYSELQCLSTVAKLT